MKLVICEKPSVAKAVASALGVTSRADGCFEGNGLIVSWCVGHLMSPMDAAGYDPAYKKWKYDDLPILPEPFRYVLAKGKEDAFQNLKRLMERPDVTELVNACDAGREGELIFRLVYEAAGCSKPFSRLWISSMEDAAIREGFADLRPGGAYDPLYQSALCRQKADWLIGINASRLFSVLYHRTLNVGRVQTPTLAMLVDRDSRITLFRKEKYHHVRLALDGAEAVSEKIAAPEEAESLRAACDFFKVDPEEGLIVIYDDISLAPGQLRVRKKGSAGGHNGIKNIIANLGSSVFPRIKVGVGEKPKGYDLADYVLGKFSKEDRVLMEEGYDLACEASALIMQGAIDQAMNEYNQKKKE